MVIQRKQWQQEAEDAFVGWEEDPAPQNTYSVIVAYGRLELYGIPPQRLSLPHMVFEVGFEELCSTVKSLRERALELATVVDKTDPELFRERVEDLMYSFHQFMGAWGYIYRHYDPTDPAVKAYTRDLYGAVADRYQALLHTLNSKELTPVLAVGARVLNEIRESLPRTSTARHWCYLRLKSMVDDAVATQFRF